MGEIPTDPIPASEYVKLGEQIDILRKVSTNTRLHLAVSELESFINALNNFGFTYPSDRFNSSLGYFKRLDETVLPLANLSAEQADSLCKLVDPTAEVVLREAERRQTIVLKTGDVTQRLKDLPSTLPKLNDSQMRLLHEAVRGLECGALRSAAVMGWNLAYDFIRQWVFDDVARLAAFNGALTSNYIDKKGNAVYEPIAAYNDFLRTGAPGESIVLDCCKSANMIGGNIHDDLRKHLRTRNNYAHPSDRVPTPTQVNAYIEDLIDIITRTPFK